MQTSPLAAVPVDTTKHGAWRLRKHAEYQQVYKSSRKQQSSSMAFFAAARPTPHGTHAMWLSARVGLTVGRVLGKAVERNRIKRRLREAVKANLHLLPPHADVVLHPRRTVLTVDYGALTLEVEKIFGLIAGRMGSVSR
jgi:ribonuclease P protein component